MSVRAPMATGPSCCRCLYEMPSRLIEGAQTWPSLTHTPLQAADGCAHPAEGDLADLDLTCPMALLTNLSGNYVEILVNT